MHLKVEGVQTAEQMSEDTPPLCCNTLAVDTLERASRGTWSRRWSRRRPRGWPTGSSFKYGDAYLDDVLVKDSDTGPEIMIIDWEDSCKSNPAVDLAACAVGTCFTLTLDEESKDTSVEFVTGRFAALVRGYQS